MIYKVVSYDSNKDYINSISSSKNCYEVTTFSNNGRVNIYEMDFNTLQKFLQVTKEAVFRVNKKMKEKSINNKKNEYNFF